jgi:hypothetical protein
MIKSIWEWYWQRIANKHFMKWIRTGNQDELRSYCETLDKKFFQNEYSSWKGFLKG